MPQHCWPSLSVASRSFADHIHFIAKRPFFGHLPYIDKTSYLVTCNVGNSLVGHLLIIAISSFCCQLYPNWHWKVFFASSLWESGAILLATCFHPHQDCLLFIAGSCSDGHLLWCEEFSGWPSSFIAWCSFFGHLLCFDGSSCISCLPSCLFIPEALFVANPLLIPKGSFVNHLHKLATADKIDTAD